jgi:hypothetical protein
MKGGLQQRNETKENPMSVGKPFGRSNKVAPLVPQIKPMAKPGTFIDDDFQSISPYSQSTSSSKTGSPVRSGRIKMFSVEGDTPYAVDIGAAFGHGTQSAIDSLAEDIDEEMVKIDKKLRGVVRSANSSKVMSIKERKKTKFAVQRTKKKIKSSLHKMRMVREGVVHGGTSFMYSSSDDDGGGGDEDAVMTGLEHHDKSLNAVGSAQLFKPLDPNIKKQLIVALKMKRTYKSALTDVSEKYRKSLAELDKLHGELANMQSELEIAHTQATRRGGGIGGSAAFAVSNVNESKRDEEDRARRDRERKKLLSAAGGGDGEDDLAGDIDSNQPQALKLCNKIGKCYSKYKPLRQDVSKIEQRFGTSVASYFHFYQWMFLNSIIVWLLYVLGFGYHLYINTNLCTTSYNDTWNAEMSNEIQKDVQFIACRPRGLCQVTNQVGKVGDTPCHIDIHCPASGKCLMQYDYFPYPYLNLLDRIPFAFRTSTAGSWVPELFMFSSFTASEAWIYTCMLLISIFVMMIQTVIKWSAEDRKLKMINAFEGSRASQNKYAKLVLNSWDHNLQTVREIRDHKLFIAESLRMLVQDAKAAESSSSRTLKQKVVLYLRRGFFIFLYIVIQTGGMALIVITLAGQSEYIKLAGDWLFENTGGALEITPIVVGIVNGIIPQLTTRLLKQEKYDDQGTVIKQTVLRIFLTKTFNILIQVVSYLLLQDPFLFTGLESPPQFLGEWHASKNFKPFQFINLRSIFKKSFTTAITKAKNSENKKADFANAGRVNQVGLNLFSFLYIAFATEIVMAFLFPGIAIITAKLKKKPLKKAQFDVALKMIGLLYFMQICLFTMPFMPLVGSIFIFLLYLKFKMEFFLTNRFGRKPKKAWAAKDSGEFFLKFYLVSIFIWIVINYLFLVTSTQPKSCSSQFKYLPETVELDGTKYTSMNLISQECDDLWHDLEGSSSKISAKDYLFDKYIELPAPCDENDQERCAGKTSTMQVCFFD